jgi:hypothetical protein
VAMKSGLMPNSARNCTLFTEAIHFPLSQSSIDLR